MQQKYEVQLLKGGKVSTLSTFTVEGPADEEGFDAMMVFAAMAAASALCTESRDTAEEVRVLRDGEVYITEQEASSMGAFELGRLGAFELGW